MAKKATLLTLASITILTILLLGFVITFLFGTGSNQEMVFVAPPFQPVAASPSEFELVQRDAPSRRTPPKGDLIRLAAKPIGNPSVADKTSGVVLARLVDGKGSPISGAEVLLRSKPDPWSLEENPWRSTFYSPKTWSSHSSSNPMRIETETNETTTTTTTTTDDQGRFELTWRRASQPSQSGELLVRRPAHSEVAIDLPLVFLRLDMGDLTLSINEPDVWSSEIQDEFGQPISSVRVSAWPCGALSSWPRPVVDLEETPPIETSTDDAGQFRLFGLGRSGHLLATYLLEGPLWASWIPGPGDLPETLVIPPAIQWAGKVVDEADGRPVPDAEVHRLHKTPSGWVGLQEPTVSDSEGMFVLRVRPNSSTALGSSAALGVVSTSHELKLIELDGSEDFADLELRIGSPRLVRIHVRDQKSGRPLAGASIRLLQEQFLFVEGKKIAVASLGLKGVLTRRPLSAMEGEIDEVTSGEFGARIRLDSPFFLEAECPGYIQGLKGPFSVFEQDEPAEITIRLSPGSSVRGRVISVFTGAGVPDCSIRLLRSGETAFPWEGRTVASDANGFFSVSGVPAGSYVLVAGGARGMTPAVSQEIRFDEAPTEVEQNLVLQEAAILAGDIVSHLPDVGPPYEIRLEKIDADPVQEGWIGELLKNRLRSTSDSKGRFVLQELNPGTWNVEVYAARKAFKPTGPRVPSPLGLVLGEPVQSSDDPPLVSQQVSVMPGESVETVLTIGHRKTGWARLFVTLIGVDPLGPIRYRTRLQSAGFVRHADPDSGGLFDLGQVPAGPSHLSVCGFFSDATILAGPTLVFENLNLLPGEERIVELEIRGVGSVWFEAFDASSGRPLEDFKIQYAALKELGVSGGVYSRFHQPTLFAKGEFVAIAAASGYRFKPQRLVIPEGESTHREKFFLTPAEPRMVTFVDLSGHPLSNALLRIKSCDGIVLPDKIVPTMTSSNEGQAELGVLPAGQIELEVVGPDSSRATVMLDPLRAKTQIVVEF